jgi:protein polybromo-1
VSKAATAFVLFIFPLLMCLTNHFCFHLGPTPRSRRDLISNLFLLSNQVFECGWDKCDFQFEDPGDALEHAVAEANGCVQRYFHQLSGSSEPTVYHCLWRNCIRAKRNQPPLPNIQRLVKHVREVHVVKAPGKIVMPQDRGKNYIASTRKHLHQHNPSSNVTHVLHHQQQQQQQVVYHHQASQQVITTPISTGSPQMNYINQQPMQHQQNVVSYVSAPVEPLFVTVPPRPQRVLHSEAYIKYIEGLQNNSSYVGHWTKTMKATRDTLGSDTTRLPSHWLGEKAKEKPGEIVDALWNLRNFMWRDAMALNRSNF